MSIPTGNVCCHGCAFEGVIQRRSITLRYELSAGEFIDNFRVVGWCMSCNGIRDMEAPFNVSMLQTEIARRKSQESNLGSFFKRVISRLSGGDTDEAATDLDRLESLLQVAKSRRSTARCLSCSEPDAIELRFDEKDNTSNFVHTCGSRLYKVPEYPDGLRFSYRPKVILLDKEGRRKQRENESD